MYKIRTATPDDAAQLLQVYAPYVKNTAITFEYEVPSVEEFRERVVHTLEHYPYIVAEEDGKILGYSYASRFRTRRAYDHCVEMSIYIAQDQRGHGVGRALYTEIESRLRKMHIRNLNASIGWTPRGDDEHLTNDSEYFHEKMGYTKVAHFHECGYKYGEWYDMIWMEKILRDVTPKSE